MAFRKQGSGSGGGIRIVKELPEPVQGRQPLIVYVEADYTPAGPYRAEDFDITVTPVNLPPPQGFPTQRIGYSVGDLQPQDAAFGVAGAGGALDPAIDSLQGVFAGRAGDGQLIVVPTAAAVVAYAQGRADTDLLVTDGAGNSYTLSRLQDYWISDGAANQIAAADAWVAGTPVVLRITSPDGQTGFTPEGLRSIGDAGSPRNLLGEPVAENFYHVSPETGLWVEGLSLIHI